MLHSTDSTKLEQIRLASSAYFGPLLLREALRRLCHAQGPEALARFEKAMADLVEQTEDERADFEAMREFAIEQLFCATNDVRRSPDSGKPREDVTRENVKGRRTEGRSEEPHTLEEQLQSGLEDSFPASDPPAVVSTSIPGVAKHLVGTDEVLRQQRRAKAER